MEELENLYNIPKNECPKVFMRYYSAVCNHRSKTDPNFNLQEFDKPFRDFIENYWIKYHQNNETSLRIVLATLANCSVEDLPSELINCAHPIVSVSQGLFHPFDAHQTNYLTLKVKYNNELPSFYERVIYYGFNVLYQNDEYLHAKIDNEEHRLVLSQIYMNYKKEVA